MLAILKSLQRMGSKQMNPNKDMAERLFKVILSLEAGASKLSTWSLSILGGSLLTIISDSYLHPSQLSYKKFYLLFIVGWICIGISIYKGFLITRTSIAADLYKGDLKKLVALFEKCNKVFKWQIITFGISLIVFGLWLMLYLCWWIFIILPVKK
jgi:MFS family permease